MMNKTQSNLYHAFIALFMPLTHASILLFIVFACVIEEIIKCSLYHEVRNQPTPAIDLQKFTTTKSSIQYKRHLLLHLFHQAHLQVRDRLSQYAVPYLEMVSARL